MKNSAIKSLSERVAARLHNKTSLSASNRAAFLALSGEIKQALHDGWKSKHIWETLHDEKKINFSYTTFHTYVLKHILLPSEKVEKRQEKPETLSGRNLADKEAIKGFSYNPVPNIEDLI